MSPGPGRAWPEHSTVPIAGTKAERRAARERVGAYHQSQLAGLLSHVGAAIDGYRAAEIDAYALDETIHHHHRAAGELWKFCFSRGGGVHRQPARPYDRQCGNHQLVGTRHAATTPVITSHTQRGCVPDDRQGCERGQRADVTERTHAKR